jgi:hypothetical protein
MHKSVDVDETLDLTKTRHQNNSSMSWNIVLSVKEA